VRLIFKNLNILRSILNSISTSFEIRAIIESAGVTLPNLFDFSAFGVLWKEGLLLYLYQEESCLPSFTQEVLQNMVRVLSTLGEGPIAPGQINLQVVMRKYRPNPAGMNSQATLQSHLTLPLAIEGEIIGCLSLSSDRPNAFDVQDLQFFSVIGYQMAASLKHFQRFSSLKNIAIYDALTRLYNRRYLEERLGVEAQRSFLTGVPLSVVMVDIDHFKKVNDTFGHAAGDKVLHEIAALLKNSVRKDDVVARYGGEEFILILPGAPLERAAVIAERIRQSIESTTFDLDQAKIHLTISLGVSTFPSHAARTKGELVQMADEALYHAKRTGRNRVCIFGAQA
jgi:diguanylate cyclase (GGDEF)-like protein